MANIRTKIVAIGVGSNCFGPSLKDFFFSDDFCGSTLTLVDTDKVKLEQMAAMVRHWNAHTGRGLRIEHTVDRRLALDGAEFVINSIALNRNELWKHDFRVPRKHGIRQSLGENGGPGGLFFTMRTIPAVFDIVRDIERQAAGAYFINFSNPESRIVCALGKYTKVKALGLCHGIFGSRWLISEITGVPDEEIAVHGAGINHFQWLLSITRKGTGEDLYPLLREKERAFDPTRQRLVRELFRTFGYWPTCGDSHTGEYLPYGWQGEGCRSGYDYRRDERDRKKYAKYLKHASEDAAYAATWLERPTGEKAAPIIAGIMHNRHELVESGVVYNGPGFVPNLPREAAVEVPLLPNATGFNPYPFNSTLPDACAKLLLPAVSNQQLAVEAAVHGSKELALQALFVDPVVDDMDAARKILDELWAINAPYIRRCV